LGQFNEILQSALKFNRVFTHFLAVAQPDTAMKLWLRVEKIPSLWLRL
jgi:hypothetical protein